MNCGLEEVMRLISNYHVIPHNVAAHRQVAKESNRGRMGKKDTAPPLSLPDLTKVHQRFHGKMITEKRPRAQLIVHNV